MEPIRNVFITLEQFEEIQSKYDGVCEYLNGEILFSSRTSRQHNRVVRKILTKLDIYLEGSKCEPFAEQIEVWSYVNILDTKSQTFLCCTSS